jgi:hypothetical protein
MAVGARVCLCNRWGRDELLVADAAVVHPTCILHLCMQQGEADTAWKCCTRTIIKDHAITSCCRNNAAATMEPNSRWRLYRCTCDVGQSMALFACTKHAACRHQCAPASRQRTRVQSLSSLCSSTLLFAEHACNALPALLLVFLRCAGCCCTSLRACCGRNMRLV